MRFNEALWQNFVENRLQKNKNETFTNASCTSGTRNVCVLYGKIYLESTAYRIADDVVSLNRSTFLEAGRLEKLSPEERRTNHTRVAAAARRRRLRATRATIDKVRLLLKLSPFDVWR